MNKKAVVLFSGGVDSTTCIAIAKAQGFAVYALSFDYGQRHAAELLIAKKTAQLLQVAEHKIVSLGLKELGGSALTDSKIAVPDYSDSNDIPITYVPARNTVFLAVALGYAEVIGAQDVFIGTNSIDYSHYPDCRPEYILAFETLANLATKAGVTGHPFTIHTPLATLSKADIIATGMTLGINYFLTVSCYQADEKGRGCGHCASCTLRKRGFEAAGLPDATYYMP